MINKKYRFLWPLVIGVILALGILIGGKLDFSDNPERLFSANSNKDKLNRLIDYIDHEYVDEVNTDSIVDVTVNNILEKLDPHSVYIPKENMAEVTENMKGDFVGIGVSFYMYRDTITVVRAVEDGPSYGKGILPGDRILMAGEDTLYGPEVTNTSVVERLKGLEGSRVHLLMYRKSTDETFPLVIQRGRVPIKSVDAHYMLNDELGYIRANRFAETTFEEFKDALDDLLDEGASKLVLDLRDNPGGYLGIAEEMADEFLPDDKLILFTKNKKGKIDNTYATSKGDFEDRQVYVLINERSASASEIIAGALQDNDLGTIVGRRSFGKGLVQREMQLGDGSAVRLTISRYYTPTGRSIQRDYKNGSRDYYKEFTQRFHNGELTSVDSIKVADSLKFTTPKGKVVYGGGGIIPDVFVPIDSKEETIKALENLVSRFAFEHLEDDRLRYSDYDKNSFVTDFKVDDILFENFISFAQRTPRVRELNLQYYDLETQIKLYIKAALAEQLYDPHTMAKIQSGQDAMIQKVLELEADWEGKQ
ncbi:S41 family peptidase [Sediminicola luteus]|uniref:Peptidase S41 n=1 Tax=Sediminicola luteus TaxID=319238 RepID=A0A2A4GDE2_9FLAO|nr:S41 family peptidase [Sediminicola luteus]PCE66473.1 peptidase S41 [Sediminicola luteus]